MKTRQELMDEIEFETRQRRGRSPADVTITASKRKNQLNIYFRNNTAERFRKGLKFGIYKNRIIFEPDEIGYKVCVSDSEQKRNSGHIVATVSDMSKYKDWIGDYKLLWDDFYDFWYIERRENA